MFSYKALHVATGLMVPSVVCMVGEILLIRFGNSRDKKIIIVVRSILLLLSTIMFIWLLFHKELFHWNYDIATGEPVDHYSTYGKCVVFTVIALVSNIVAGIVGLIRKSREKEEEQ